MFVLAKNLAEDVTHCPKSACASYMTSLNVSPPCNNFLWRVDSTRRTVQAYDSVNLSTEHRAAIEVMLAVRRSAVAPAVQLEK